MKYQTIFLFLFCILLLSSCSESDKKEIENAASAFDIKQGEASVNQSNSRLIKAFENRDSTEVGNLFTQNAKLMINGLPSITGRENIAAFFAKSMDSGLKKLDLKTNNLWGDSSILAEEGTYKYQGANGKQIDKGKYIVLWKQEAGNWKMFRDMWTSDMPQPFSFDADKPPLKNELK